jgi:serine/threonine-protein kinase HipA
MTNDDVLKVWCSGVLVGRLWRNTAGIIGFQYEASWIDKGFAISQQLPLSAEKYEPIDGKAHQFFVNLLPEADARTHIVRDLKIANSDFELLKAVGGECAGALSILPVDYEVNSDWSYKKLTDEELKKLLRRKGNITGFTSEKDRPRLSLAGAQDKSPIFYDGTHYFLPQDAAPSTHILKFEVAGYRNIPVYECFLAELARSIGLPVVECQLKKMDREHFLLIRRYDRIANKNKKIQRLHQEDFCQALGVGYEKKYQQDGGPSFQDCYQLVQAVSTRPIVDAENLLKWLIFNALAGNSDGHAKNLAFVYKENQRAQLAPFYDLVCTRAIERIDTRLAFSIGGEFNPDRVTMKHWEQLAQENHIRKSYLASMLFQVAEALQANVVIVKEQFEARYGVCPALQRVQKVVIKQCKKLLRA